MSGIYLHIPYCTQACHYCDFHFSTNRQSLDAMMDAMVRELDLRQDYLTDKTVMSIYFGGGTPSILNAGQVDRFIRKIGDNFLLSPDAEVTLEANPEDLTEQQAESLLKAGVNRLSIGIQSFDDETLRFLNRCHDGRQALTAIGNVRRAGFSNISTDLIFSIPGRTAAVLESDLRQLERASPEHISAYSLTVEEKTVFGKRAVRGMFQAVPEDEQAREFELVMDVLEAAGYLQYEISNFAKAGFHARHNSGYWSGRPYLGIGPGAHSFDGKHTRHSNIANNHRYIAALKGNQLPLTAEMLSLEQRANEYLMTSLRTSAGCSLSRLRQEFGYDLQGTNESYIRRLTEGKLASISGDRLILTRSGKMIADRIAGDLFQLT